MGEHGHAGNVLPSCCSRADTSSKSDVTQGVSLRFLHILRMVSVKYGSWKDHRYPFRSNRMRTLEAPWFCVLAAFSVCFLCKVSSVDSSWGSLLLFSAVSRKPSFLLASLVVFKCWLYLRMNLAEGNIQSTKLLFPGLLCTCGPHCRLAWVTCPISPQF